MSLNTRSIYVVEVSATGAADITGASGTAPFATLNDYIVIPGVIVAGTATSSPWARASSGTQINCITLGGATTVQFLVIPKGVIGDIGGLA